MASCNENRLKHRCGSISQSVCTQHISKLPEWSKLTDDSCVMVSETIDELYDEVSLIKNSTDLSNLRGCFDYVSNKPNEPTVKEVLQKHQDILCDLLKGVTHKGVDTSMDIQELELDYKGIPFTEEPKSLKELFQLLIDKVVEPQVIENSNANTPLIYIEDTGGSETLSMVDEEPRYEDTGIRGCSSTEYRYTSSNTGSYGFKQQIDKNKHSRTYNKLIWVRDSNNDFTCNKIR